MGLNPLVPEQDMSLDEPNIDAAAFSAFAGAKGITTKCLSCGQDGQGWTVYNTSGLPASLIGTRKGQTLVSPPVIQLVPIHCNNCGYVRTFDRNLMAAWLKENNNG